jgi:hypothetical protein
MNSDKYEIQARKFFAVSAVFATFSAAYFLKNYIEYRRTLADIEARKKAGVRKNAWVSEQIIKEIQRGRYDRRGIDGIFADWKYYQQVAPG